MVEKDDNTKIREAWCLVRVCLTACEPRWVNLSQPDKYTDYTYLFSFQYLEGLSLATTICFKWILTETWDNGLS